MRSFRATFAVGCALALIVSCSSGVAPPAGSPTSSAGSTTSVPQSLGASLAITPPTLPALDDAIPAAMEAEVAQVHDLRREAGIAALLGTDGEGALTAIDEAQAEHAEADLPALVDALGLGAGAHQFASIGGPPQALPATFDDWTPTYSGRTAYTASMLTAVLATAIGSSDTDRPRTSQTSNETPADRTTGDIREHVTMRTTLTLQTGAGRIQGEVELVTTTQASSVSTGAALGSLSATARGQIDVNACPDPDGVAEGTISMAWQEEITTAGGSSAGGSASFDAPIRMLDGDDAHLIETELDLSFEKGAHGPGTPGGNPGAPFDWSYQGSMSVTVPRSGQVAIPSSSGEGNGATDSQAAGAATYALTQAALIVFQITDQAERFWRAGKCVEVRTSEESRDVDPEEELTITVEAMHKFDGAQVEGPAETTFTGKEEIRPAEPIDTPGELTFVAGENPGDEGTLDIKHTSKRGIGTKSLTFTVGGGFHLAMDGRLTLDSPNDQEIIVSEQAMTAQDDGSYILETAAAVSGTYGLPGCSKPYSSTLPIRVTARPSEEDPNVAEVRVELTEGLGLLGLELTCQGATTLWPVPLNLWVISFYTPTSAGRTVTIDEPTTVQGMGGSAGATTIVNLTRGD